MHIIRSLIVNKDRDGLLNSLREHPHLANEGIPFDEENSVTAHPLHRICDGVFQGLYTDGEALEMARIFIACGADIDGYELKEKQDTPLIAAASLHAEKTGIFYLEQGANIHHPGSHGGTALHWAAYTGRDQLVKRLLAQQADVNRRCIDFRSTPLGWAVHGYKSGGEANRHHQPECVRLLLEKGADKTIPNMDGRQPIEFLGEEDTALLDLLR